VRHVEGTAEYDVGDRIETANGQVFRAGNKVNAANRIFGSIDGYFDRSAGPGSTISEDLYSQQAVNISYPLTEFVPLLQSSASSKQFDTVKYISARDHSALLNDFVDGGKPLTVAAIVRGEAKSAFDERPEAQKSEEGDAESADTVVVEHVSQSENGINVLLVADVDMISDRLWVQVSNFMGQRMAMPWASNGDFVANAVELLAGSDDLIGLRSRGQYSRSFTVVNELRVQAAEQFKQQEQNLQQQLADLEAKISSMSPDTNADNEPVLSAEQEQAIKEFEAQRFQVRKQLRQVQHQLNSSIEALETRLKVINIFLVPALLIVLLLVLRLRRARS